MINTFSCLPIVMIALAAFVSAGAPARAQINNPSQTNGSGLTIITPDYRQPPPYQPPNYPQPQMTPPPPVIIPPPPVQPQPPAQQR